MSGRKIFVCDGAIAPGAVLAVEAAVKALSFTRTEASLLGMAPTASSAEIPATPLMASFIAQLQGAAEQLFSGETFRAQRAYVNRSVYGDAYYVHRDLCAVTVLYYVNLVWEPDWGGETIYFDDDNDAQLVVSPRPGRLVVARGDILHRASVPARDCPEERLTIALKLANA
ncbi:MAG TPA: 2OG-Fe(II) oxygenase [Rhizomicrobium sp.]|nr:2OG-Fe(II) oxygenase [Rhizomicrobium sp.]